MLTISKLKRWSSNYHIDTAAAAEHAERDTRTPVWLLAGDTHTVATQVGLNDVQRAGGHTDAGLVARWLDDGTTPNGARPLSLRRLNRRSFRSSSYMGRCMPTLPTN